MDGKHVITNTSVTHHNGKHSNTTRIKETKTIDGDDSYTINELSFNFEVCRPTNNETCLPIFPFRNNYVLF